MYVEYSAQTLSPRHSSTNKKISDDERLQDCGGDMNKLGNATLQLFMAMSTEISLSGM
jgi:hypothetical protein